jgi:hypothetical protein
VARVLPSGVKAMLSTRAKCALSGSPRALRVARVLPSGLKAMLHTECALSRSPSGLRLAKETIFFRFGVGIDYFDKWWLDPFRSF